MSASPIRLAVREWQEQAITGTHLMRQLVSFEHWHLLVARAGAADPKEDEQPVRLLYSEDAEGISRLYLFSDEEAYTTFLQATGQASRAHDVLITNGVWVFTLPLEQFDMVEIDPASPWQIGYQREQFPALRAMAEAVAVEQALTALQHGEARPETLQQVRDYEHYLLPVFAAEGDRYALALAPDPQGRALAAVFTAPDAFEAFVEALAMMLDNEELLQLEVPGPVLFAQLAQTSLDGLVFNSFGPGQPVAFALPFASLMLEA